jgi:hypothetical protein
MLRNGTVILAVLLVLGTPGSAVARGGYSGGSAGDGFRDDHSRPLRLTDISGKDSRRHANRASSSGGRFRAHGAGDVWRHWRAYYGPMMPTI